MRNIIFLALLFTAPNLFSMEQIRIDGSSTVFPITEAVAEEFSLQNNKVHVTVGISGTGGGFKKFTREEIDINNASREIKSIEINKAKENKVDYLEIPVAYDGITVIVNPKNTWANDITPAELKKIWQTGSKVKTWKEVRETWPDKPLKLYGPGVESGTFDYFTKVINGKSHVSRADFMKSEDDNVLVRAVAGDQYALGFLGYAYYYENQRKLKALAVHNGEKMILPNFESINQGTYRPLSRAVYIYVNKKAAKRDTVKDFIDFYLENANLLTKEVGYIPLQGKEYLASKEKFKNFRK